MRSPRGRVPPGQIGQHRTGALRVVVYGNHCDNPPVLANVELGQAERLWITASEEADTQPSQLEAIIETKRKGLYWLAPLALGAVLLGACTQPEPTLTPTAAATPPPVSTATPTRTPIPAPDVIFFNGQVVTMELDMPVVEALAVRGENIVAVGTNEDMLALGRPETSVIDLGGKTLLPGFVDSHNHLFNDAEGLMGLTLEEAQDLALRRGITAIADMFVNDEFLEQMRIFESEGRLRIRTSLYLTHTDNCGNNWGDWYRDQPPVRDPQ